MAIDANSYGSVEGVAALARRWTNASQGFDNTTKPTRVQVEAWIDQISSMLNGLLAANRFTIPITQADAKRIISAFVNQEAAMMVEGSHDIGRLGPTALTGTNSQTTSVTSAVMGDIREYIEMMADGLEAMGASRASTRVSVGSYAVIRADGYSNDVNSNEATAL